MPSDCQFVRREPKITHAVPEKQNSRDRIGAHRRMWGLDTAEYV